MKIIAGELKGRLIEMPKGIRPTSDKVREAFFEIVKDRIGEADFLDLYCGSGAMGIEAFSRGARSVCFVDNNFRCIKALKRNIYSLNIDYNLNNIEIYKKGVLRQIELLHSLKRIYDIVFLDPPYYKDIAKNTLIALSDYDILARNALIIIESHAKDELPEKAGLIKRFRVSLYGDTKLEFYKI